jgi:hypothetical protein
MSMDRLRMALHLGMCQHYEYVSEGKICLINQSQAPKMRDSISKYNRGGTRSVYFAARMHRCRYQGSEPSTGTTMIVCPNDSILVGAT